MITQQQQQQPHPNHHPRRLKVRPDPLLDEIEINLASSASLSFGSSPATSPAPSPAHYLGLLPSSTPRPTDELLGDDTNDDDDSDDEEGLHNESEHKAEQEVDDDAEIASISDEVLLSRHDSEPGGEESSNSNNQHSEMELFQSSSCCAGGEQDDDNDRLDHVQDILQTASSLIMGSVPSPIRCPPTSDPDDDSALVEPKAEDGRTIPLPSPSPSRSQSQTPLSLLVEPLLRIATKSPVMSAFPLPLPSTPPPPPGPRSDSRGGPSTTEGDAIDDDDDKSSGNNNDNDSPISRYRKEAEERHLREIDLDSEQAELLSARLIAATATVTAVSRPGSAVALTPTPTTPFHFPLPLVRVPHSSLSGAGHPASSMQQQPMSNMSPLSLDSSSRFHAAGGGGSYAGIVAAASRSQPQTPVPFGDDSEAQQQQLLRRMQQRRQQELLYFDDLMLLPPTPREGGDDEDDDENDNEHDDGEHDGIRTHGDDAASRLGGTGSDPSTTAPATDVAAAVAGSDGDNEDDEVSAPMRPRDEAIPKSSCNDDVDLTCSPHEPQDDSGPRSPRRRVLSRRTERPSRRRQQQQRSEGVGRSLVDADEDEEEEDEVDEDDEKTALISSANDNGEESGTESGADRGGKDQERNPADNDDDNGAAASADRRQLSVGAERRDPSSGSTAETDPANSPTHRHERRMQPLPPDWEEKKEALELPTLLEEDDGKPDRLRANSPPVVYHLASGGDPLASSRRPRYPHVRSASADHLSLSEMEKTLSMTESDVGSLDGLPSSLKSRWGNDFSRSEKEALQRIDGVSSVVTKKPLRRASTPDAASATLRPIKVDVSKQVAATAASSQQPPLISQLPPQRIKKPHDSFSFFSNWPMKLFWGDNDDGDATKDHDHQAQGLGGAACCRQEEEDSSRPRFRWTSEDDSLALLACANLIHQRPGPAVPSSLIRVSNDAPPPSFCQTYNPSSQNRMPAWVEHQFRTRDKSTKDGQYLLGTSRAVIVHEIVRGNWTWATAWSPDGSHLAVATENHHLAVLDTTSSTVWRVRHDKKLQGPVKQGTTHSIRSIAWGKDFIAIGGTGNAVSIISPVEPYAVIQTIPNCGFVGSLDWRPNSNELVIGSRLDRAMIVRVRATTATPPPGPCSGTIDAITNLFPQSSVLCETIYTVERKHWVNSVAYSPTGRYLAVGDAGGSLLVYDLHDAALMKHDAPMDETKELVGLFKTFTLDDSVLAVEWSPDGLWLYAGGEDFAVTVIDTQHWEMVHKIKRDRWVQCIAASRSGSHVAVGGVSSEVSLLETKTGWDSVMGMELNGLVPLSAKWHPRDQFLSLTGQNNSILVVETTNARHVRGHHLHSVGGILAVEFSPDGRMAVVGNESGVVTFYSLSGSSFVTSYELVVMVENDRLSIQWSRNGLFVVIATRDSMLIVGRKRRDRYGKAIPPKCSGFSIRKVVKDLNGCHAVSIDLQSQYVAVAGSKGTSILDVSRDFAVIREWPSGPCYAAAWSPLGRWLATIGKDKVLTIYDTGEERVDRWRPVFSVTCDYVGRALAWGPLIVGGLLYLAYAGDGNEINVMEIRTQEGTWETILRIQRPGAINALDWHMDGLLAAALSNGTVSIVDLAYLQSGVAVNEMDYNWQRQALTSFTEIRRNRGSNLMRAVRWIPSAPGSDCLLAVGGSDGELEIVDLTERQRCRGYAK